MGTHPIFESDFDCLTDKKSEKMASRKTKKPKKRAQRATSNVFAMFGQDQIQEFKEAFTMIDQNRDGFIDTEDLHDMLASLGKDPTQDYLERMVSEAPGPINFTMFLTMFGENNSGKLNEEYLREMLMTTGDRYTEEQVDELLREAPIDANGDFDYIEFVKILKNGKVDPDANKIEMVKLE